MKEKLLLTQQKLFEAERLLALASTLIKFHSQELLKKNPPYYIKFSNFTVEEDEKSVKYQEGNTDRSNTRLSELD